MRARAAKLLPTEEDRSAELARLCTLVLDEARGLLEPLASPARFERIVTDNQVLNLQRDAASFCSRFVFFFVHVAPDAPNASAQQFLTAQPHVMELYRLLDEWRPTETSRVPAPLAEQARACLVAFGLPLPEPAAYH
ncbi:MAG TPA: hypothetical protein VE057_04050 [Archangium sp.]|nr:hypothetical protein [Archangium sp.]